MPFARLKTMESLKQLYSLAMDAYLGCSVIQRVSPEDALKV